MGVGGEHYEWDAVKRLGAYLDAGIDDALVEQLSSHPDGRRSLELICRSTDVFTEIYSPDNAERIIKAIFETDFSTLQGEDREEAFARDVFQRLTGRIELKKGAYDDPFTGFGVLFRRFLRWYRAALDAVLSVQGLKKEEVSLESAGVRRRLAELRELPCRRLGELSFSHRMEESAALARYLPPLLKKYENTVIPEESCRSIVEVMGKVSGFPGYYRVMGPEQKLAEVRPILLAISELQLDPAGGREKDDLLAALGLLLFNVYPSVRLLKFIARLKPDPENDDLSHEYYAILAMNHLLAGRLDEAAGYNEQARDYAADEEKMAYTYILDSCIWLHRRDFGRAVDALGRCSALTRDKRMRAVARFYAGIVHYETGDVAAAYECFKKSRAGLDDELDSMNVYNNIGTCAMVLGDLKAAARAFRHVEHLGKYMGSNTAKLLLSVACGNLGITYLSVADYGRAAGYFKAALKLSRDLHDKKGVANQLANIGVALKLKRDYGLARKYFRSSLNASFLGDYAEGALFSFSQIEQLLALEGRYGEVEGLKQEMMRQNPDIARMLRR